MDVCAKIQQLPKLNEEVQTVYYFEKCGYNLDRNKLNELIKE